MNFNTFFQNKKKKAIFIVVLFVLFFSLVPVRFDFQSGNLEHSRAFAAEDDFKYEFIVPVPQPQAGGGEVATSVSSIPEYINILYLFGLAVGGILAFGALVYGGFLWTVSGAAGTSGKAKSIISNALLGVAILATSYIMLHTINPDLVGPQSPTSTSPNVSPGSDDTPLPTESCPPNVTGSESCGAYTGMAIAAFRNNNFDAYTEWMDACKTNECDICSSEKNDQGVEQIRKDQKNDLCVWEMNRVTTHKGVPFQLGRCKKAEDAETCDELSGEGEIDDNPDEPNPGDEDECEKAEDCEDEHGSLEGCREWLCEDGECKTERNCPGTVSDCVCKNDGSGYSCTNCLDKYANTGEQRFEMDQCLLFWCQTLGDKNECVIDENFEGDNCEQFECPDCKNECYTCESSGLCSPKADAECGIEGSIGCSDGKTCDGCQCVKEKGQECTSSGECGTDFCGNDSDADGYYASVEEYNSSCPGPDRTGECMKKPSTLDCNPCSSEQNAETDWYKDADGDDCWSDKKEDQCEDPGGNWFREDAVDLNCDDCDDSNPTVNENETETCNNVDHDCDGDPCNISDPGSCEFCCEETGQTWTETGVGDAKCCPDNNMCVDADGNCQDGEEGKSFEDTCWDGADNDCDGEADCGDDDCIGASCDDDSYCTLNDECTSSGCEGEDRDCSDPSEAEKACDTLGSPIDDPNACTQDSCSYAEDCCVHDLVCDGSLSGCALGSQNYCDNCLTTYSVNSCEDYKQYKGEVDGENWKNVCKQDPCGVNSAGCKTQNCGALNPLNCKCVPDN